VATLVARQREPFRLYLESDGIFEMVRNLVTNTDASGTPTSRR
jgi:hypothetical protein